MKVLFYSVKSFEKDIIHQVNKNRFHITLKEDSLNLESAFLARGYEAICIFSNDMANNDVLRILHSVGVKYINIRCTGFDNIDLEAADELGIKITNVPVYSPESIAEHTVMLILNLLKKSKICQTQIANQDFSLNNIIGKTINNKTVGIIGTGEIGSIVVKILSSFGARLIAHDLVENKKLKNDYKLKYVDLNTLAHESDIITIHTPLTSETHHLINNDLMSRMKKEAIIINTARGAIVKTQQLIEHLKNKTIGGYGMDVYENEKDIFFYNHSKSKIIDSLLNDLMKMNNVIITPHQAFATYEALLKITEITFDNIKSWYLKEKMKNEIHIINRSKSLSENLIS